MLKEFTADLHVHTCLSPCGELEMTPSAVISTACHRGIDIIAITDHNSAENFPAASTAAARGGITILAGMEICSSEEAHILALFNDREGVMALQDIVYKSLLPGENDEKLFGEQIVVNEQDEVLDFNKRLLIGATSMSAHEVVHIIHSLGGLSIASHVDRDAFSVISQLGMIPGDLKLDALEFSPRISRDRAEQEFAGYRDFAWISSSDAHMLSSIGIRTTKFFMTESTIEEMKLALKNIDGRKVVWE